MDTLKERKVFISYSWTSEKHEAWVYELAERLMVNDGIEVKFDKWDLQPGQDKYKFMESMVTDSSIDRVLIICDRRYKEKADSREGGVGTETQIITPEIYRDTNQEKFIPIFAEIGDDFNFYLPTFIKTRIGINMSSDLVYEEGYEQLVRLIYERPQYRKPEKGEMPSYLIEDEKSNFKTRALIKQLKHYIINKPDQTYIIVDDFVKEFIELLGNYEIDFNDFKDPYDDKIYNNINEMLDLRNDYIDFMNLISKTKNFNIEIVIDIFEKISIYTNTDKAGRYNRLQYDHYKFFITELFIYTTIVLIENQKFIELNDLLSTKYFVSNSNYDSGVTFSYFRFYVESLDEFRNKRLKLIKLSLTAEILIQRTVVNGKEYKKKLMDADLLLYYISVIKFKPEDMNYWFPATYIYNPYDKNDVLKRITSKRYFDKVKILFGIETGEEMKNIIGQFLDADEKGYKSSYDRIPNIRKHFNIDEIGKY